MNISLTHTFITKKTSLLWRVGYFISLAFGQWCSEPASLIFIGISGLIFLYFLFKKHWSKAKQSLLPPLWSILAFAVLFFSHGSISRRESSPDFNAHWVFIDSLHGFRELFLDINIWLAAISILVIAALLLNAHKTPFVKKYPWHIFAGSVVTFLLGTYGVFVLNNIAQNYMPLRVLTIPAACVVFAVYGATLSLYTIALPHLQKFTKYRPHVTSLFYVITICASGYILYTSVHYIEKLALRSSIVKVRDAQLREHIANPDNQARPIHLMSARNLTRGNADDFYYADGKWDRHGRNWIINDYLDYIGVGSESPQGQIVIIDPPANYR